MNLNFWRDKRVLITGHTGFKGSWLSLWLHNLGAEVSGFSLPPKSKNSLFNLLDLSKKINSIYGDIRIFDNLQQNVLKLQPEIVIHMAAQPLVRYSYKNPIETYETNVMGTVNLLESSKYSDSIKVILNVTSDKCYENKEWVWAYRENESMGGYDPYSSSKGCSEIITSSYRNSFFNANEFSDHGKTVATARAGNVIGGGDWAEDRLIPDLIRSIIEKKPIIIRNPKAIRPWQHVLEPLSGYLTLIENLWRSPKKYSGAWNFGPEENDAKNVQTIVEYFLKSWGGNLEWHLDKQSPHHEANYLKLDTSKAKNLLNWFPRWSLEETLSKIVDWYKNWEEGNEIIAITENQIDEFISSINDGQ